MGRVLFPGGGSALTLPARPRPSALAAHTKPAHSLQPLLLPVTWAPPHHPCWLFCMHLPGHPTRLGFNASPAVARLPSEPVPFFAKTFRDHQATWGLHRAPTLLSTLALNTQLRPEQPGLPPAAFPAVLVQIAPASWDVTATPEGAL